MPRGGSPPAVRSLAVTVAQQSSARVAPPEPSSTAASVVSTPLIVLTALAVVAGLALRFVARTPLWLDEALSVNIASLPVGQIPDALRHDGHPPLYYFLLHGWMELFGTTDVAVRALSGVISVITLPLAWLVGRRRGGPVLGCITLAVVALAPFALRYATETRMYALVMFLVFAGYLLVDDVVRRERRGWWRLALIALITAALLYTHYWSMWFLAATFGVLAWQAWRGTAARTGARQVLVAMVVGGLAFLPWLGVLTYQSANTGTPWASPQRPTSVVAVMLGDFGGGGFRDAEFVGTVLAVLFLLGLFGRGIARDRIDLELRTERQFRFEALVVGLTLGIGTAVGYATTSTFASRYASVVFPLFVIVVAGGLSRFVGKWVQFGVVAAVLALSLMGAFFGATAQRTQAGQIGTAVADHAQPGDLVVYCPDQLGPSSEREMPDGLDHVVFPDFLGPERLEWVDYLDRYAAGDPATFASQAVERAGSQHGVFLVWSGDYRGTEGKCEELAAALSGVRPGGQVLVPDGGSKYYEHAQLVWFPPST
jgi:mannosyltransferase